MCRVLVRSLACRTMWIAEGLPEPRKNVNVGSAHECGKRTAGPYRVVFEHTCDRDRSGMPFPPAILKTHRVFPRSLTSVWAHSWPIRRTTPQNTSSLGFTSHHMCVCVRASPGREQALDDGRSRRGEGRREDLCVGVGRKGENSYGKDIDKPQDFAGRS
jgi:hypothetical protein